jgi:alpha-N-acetylglucosaminidase
MCPEGIENNEVVYELMTDAGWRSEAIDLNTWIPRYCASRYGSCPPAMQEAWTLLRQSAYASHTWMTNQAWQTEPGNHPVSAQIDSGPTFQRAVALFLSCADQLAGNALYRNDLIELVAQAVGGHIDQQLAIAVQAVDARQNEATVDASTRALDWMNRIDALMNLRPDRRLETWTIAARSWAKSPDEAAFYDENARRLITTWGWPELSDYASRVWSGLIRDYYAARWAAWFESRRTSSHFSLDIWQQTWLSSPYRPSTPRPVPDLIAECHQLLAECKAT